MKAVYKITNVKNGKVYIGSSSDSDKRKRDHLNLLRRGVHHNRPLYEEYNSVGEKACEFEVI
ncbi:UNVERIFIED_CONTAM: endonuclease, partial [Bacillus amyloliquefaciens DSM 7 = ATCC 23350]